MEIQVKSVLLQLGLLLLCRESFQSDLSFEATPEDVRAQLDADVSLDWEFSYGGNSTGIEDPWDYHAVKEISFGIWETFGGFSYMTKKLFAVDENGNVEIRQGYHHEFNWTSSKFNMMFTLIQVSLEDQAEYGINAEVGVAFDPLRDSLEVSLGASRQKGDGGNSSVRNVTWYLNEEGALMFPRSTRDQHENFVNYRISKMNKSVIAIGKKSLVGSICTNGSDTELYNRCLNGSYVLRYEDDNTMSFNVNSVSRSEEGLYHIQAYFFGAAKEFDPMNKFIYVKVQARPSTSPGPTVTKQPNGTSTTEPATSKVDSGGDQGIALSLLLLSLMAIFLF